jgi:hypothetical protein
MFGSNINIRWQENRAANIGIATPEIKETSQLKALFNQMPAIAELILQKILNHGA